jgi:hypothetical protein
LLKKLTSRNKENTMNIQVTKSSDEGIVVTIKCLGLVANFETMDDATKFIQSVINNIKTF